MNRKKIERPKSESHVNYDTKSLNACSKDSEDNLFDDLANLMSEINLKQKLTKELESSQRRLSNLEQLYENKLQQIQTSIKLTQQEQNTVISSLSYSNNSWSGILKKVHGDYENKLNFLQNELKSLYSAKEEYNKHLFQYENQILVLNYDKKHVKEKSVDLHYHKTKEETTKHIIDVKKAHIKNDSKKAEIRMINLESKSRSLDAILKRKQERVTEVAAKLIHNYQKDAVGNHAYQKNSNQTWIDLERDISSLSLNKQTLYSLKIHLERLTQEQKKLKSDLDTKQKELAVIKIQKPVNDNFHCNFENEIDSIEANLICVDESVEELEENILKIENSQTVSERFELNDRIHNLPEAIYVLEKLIKMYLDNLCLATQKDIDVKELESKMQQLEKKNEIQRQIIEHMLSSQESVNKKSVENMTTINDRKIRSSLSSKSASSTTSPPNVITNTHSKNDKGKNKPKHKNIQIQKVVGTSKNVKQFSEVSRIRLPNLYSLLKRDKPKLAKISSGVVRKKIERQVTMTPILIKEATFIISPNTNLPNKSELKFRNRLMPMTTPPRRRTYTRNENDLTPQMSSKTQLTQLYSKGVIQPYQEKTSLKTSLVCTHVTEGHSKAVLAIYATDDKLFSASKDTTVKIWDLNSGKEIQTLRDHPNNVVAVKYDENTQLLFSVSSSYVRVWDMRLSKSIKTLCSSGIVNNGSVMSSQIPIGEIQLNDIVLNNYGRTLYMATGDKVKIWDLRKFTVRGKLSSGHTAAVMCLTVGQFDNKDIIVTGSKDNYIKMFEVGEEATGTYSPTVNLEPPHYDGIQTLALRNQMLFSGSRDCAIKKWDLDRQELVATLNNAHSNWICGLAVVPDQKILLSVCRNGYLKMWSESNVSLLGEIKAHDSPINAVSTNSTHVFTAANDGTVKLWQNKI